MKKLSIPIDLLSRYSWTAVQFPLSSYTYINGKKVDVLGFKAKTGRFAGETFLVSPRVIQAP